MSEPDVSLASLVLLERIAGAIREELGETVDAYPGCRSPEGADPINRAFRAVTRSLVRADLAHGTDLDGIRFAGPPSAHPATPGSRGLG